MNLPPNPRLCPQWIVAFIFFVFLPLRVQAGDDFGQEFSFDAISDLAPLIALFGEQVTKQFMSQSLNWYDHIIFAMAPLGIITAIVGAIRVGGPTWLKAVIGRARESRGMAEVELMSSVSPDVCELWNGGQIVRVMGQAPVVQILYFPHLADDVNCDEKGKGGTCGLHTLETAKEAGLLIPKNERSFIEILRAFGDCIPIFRRKSKLETEETGTVRQEDSRKGTRRTQNTKQVKPCAPNITLNFDYRIRPAYLQISAAIGLILQLGVIASQAVLAKHPKYQQKNQKVDKAFAAAAFEIAVVGTLILIFSMITCSYIIEQGSREVTWVVKNDKHSFHIMWVQKARTVNDQNFDSYLLLAKGARNSLLTSHPTSLPSSVTTSSLVDGDNDTSMDEDNDDMRTSSSNSTELLVCVSAFFGIIGFVLQFVGLRGLHWSATVAQIGATFVMTALRAWVRRDLAGKPHAVILPHEFELDWLSTRLGIDAEGLPRHDVGPSGTHSDKFNFWAYAEAEREREDARKKGQRKIFSHDPIDKQQHTSINAEFWGRNCINLNFVLRQVKPHIQPQIHTLEETERPNRLARIRYRLVDLTSWDYEVTKTASALDKVIEATMESLIGSRQLDRPVEYGWPMEVFLNKRWSSVMLTVRYTDGQWRSDRAELEAVLSLWMYSLKMPSTKDVPLHDGKKGPGDPDVDNEGTEGMKVQFLGWKSKKVLRDFTWWVTGHSNPIVEVKVRRNVHLKNTNASPSNGNGQASTSPSPSTQPTTRLNLLPNFSASTLSSTSSSASSWPRSSSSSSSSSKSVSTNTHIDEAEGTWFGCGMWHPLIESQQTFALEFDTDVLELELQNKVGTTEGSVSKETALAMAKYASEPTMCAMHIFSIFLLNITRCKLSPQMENDTKVEDKSTKEFTGISIRNTALDRLAQAIHNIGFYTREEAHIMLVSAMAENGSLPGMNKVMSWAFNKAQHYESKGRYDLAGSVYMWLYQCFSVGGVEEQLVTTSLAMLWEFSRSLSKILPLLGKHEHSPSKHHDTDKKIKKLLLEKTFDNRPQNIQGVDERKLLRHLPIISSMGGRLENRGHYVHPSFREEIKQISKSNPLLIPQSLVKALKADYSILDKNLSAETDIFGRNQLHYIAVNKEAAFDSEGVDDISTSNIVDEDFPNFVSPGHEVQDHLLELWGKIEISSITAGTTSSLETRAHSNVLHGIEQEVVNSRDSLGLTPLHYAAWAGNLRALKHLLHAGADSGICGHDGKTALHCAAINGNADMVKLLAEAGSSIHAKDSHERTPLHYACEYGNGDAVDRMLKFGASISAFDSCRRTPFHMVGFIGSRFQQEARRQCTCDSIKYLLNILLENNVDPSIVLTEEHLGCTALHLATAVHNECAIRHLISFRQDSKNLDATDREGRTALHYASRNGNLNSVLQLVAGGAICDIKDNKGWTPLHDAADGGYEDIVTFLLSPQDDVSSRTYSRIHNRHSSTSSPAPHVTTCTDSNISNVLQRNGGHGVETDASIDVYLVNNSSGTPGKGKSGNGVVSEVSDICKLNDPPGHGDKNLTKKSDNEKIKSISKNKAGKSAKSYHVIDVNSGSNFNMTALHLASMKGHVGVVSSLLANGADYTLVASSPKRTAMQFAAIEGKCLAPCFCPGSGQRQI
ncbi:hypothetical protein DFH27DRAFT_216688 [Peziza echinospora]|nr:hypothetical protein DFH27DRAFT_216688 [Peziza echinospora]